MIGAGIAGLSAARALANHFGRVVVLDRDRLPDAADPRRGVPQGGHGHVLLLAGLRALEELFGDVTEELLAAGASAFDAGLGLRFHRFGYSWPIDEPLGLRLVSFSRPLLELTLRNRVTKLAAVEFRDTVAVTELTGADGRVTGVRLDDGTTIDTGLVVDCTGRGSRSDRWLGALGHEAPKVTEVKIGVGYASRLYRRSPDDLAQGNAVLVVPAPPHELRVGLALPVEGDRWVVTLGGWHGAYPRDEAGFREHIDLLPHPDLAHLLARSEPVTEIVYHQFPSSRRRHFEDLSAPPTGYLALGDAICSFNPIYGQGMTCAALEALELDRLLTSRETVTAALSTEYYRAAARTIATPWQFAVGGDFAYPLTEGPRPRGIGFLNWYTRKMQEAAGVDLGVRRTFTSVQHLVTPPAVLQRPAMMWKVLWAARRATAGRARAR
ncbi:FAD-dependent oxidoreductase [Longispora urticae]